MVRDGRSAQGRRDQVIVRAKDEERPVALNYLADKLKMAADSLVSDDKFTMFLACRDGAANGVILYKNYASGDIEMVCAGEPGWVTPSVVKFALSYPFEALDCIRITCIAHKKNRAMRDYLIRMGFKLEGVKRKAINGADATIYGLLKGERKWA